MFSKRTIFLAIGGLILLAVIRLSLEWFGFGQPLEPTAVVPGTTSTQEVAELETFYEETEGEEQRFYLDKSQRQDYTVIGAKGETVSYVLLQNPTKFEFQTLQAYEGKYGMPDLKRFGPWSESNYMSHVLLEPGLVVIAHANTGEVIEVWQIRTELSQDEFDALYGEHFAVEPPEPESHF